MSQEIEADYFREQISNSVIACRQIVNLTKKEVRRELKIKVG